MQSGMPRCRIRDCRDESVAQVCLGRRADADPRAAVAKQVELGPVRVRRVHDGRTGAEAPCGREQLDRPHAVLHEALLDLARLLVGMDVEDERVLVGVATELLEPLAWAGADGVGGDTDRDSPLTKRLDLGDVRAD